MLLLLLLLLLELTSASVIRDTLHWLLPLFRNPLIKSFRVFHERWLQSTTRLPSCNASMPWHSRDATLLLILPLKSCLSSHPTAPVLGLRFEDIFSARLCFAASGVIILFLLTFFLLLQQQQWCMGGLVVCLLQSLKWAEDAVVAVAFLRNFAPFGGFDSPPAPIASHNWGCN